MPAKYDQLRWVTILRSGVAYVNTVRLLGDQIIRGDFEINNGRILGSNEDLNLEEQFLLRIEKIVIQTLLYLQIRPDDLTTPAISTKSQGFSKKTSKNGFLNPLIIGQQFQPKTERVSTSPHSTHASPRTHWRRGHWLRVALGEQRQEREWRWIQPVLVNG